MGDVTYRHQLTIVAGKTPLQTGGKITELDFQIEPAEILEITDFNEDTSHRFKIADGTIDTSICQGTVAEAEILVIKADEGTDLNIKIVNVNGTSQNIPLIGGRTSILHTKFSDILVTNTSGSDIKGVMFIAGD